MKALITSGEDPSATDKDTKVWCDVCVVFVMRVVCCLIRQSCVGCVKWLAMCVDVCACFTFACSHAIRLIHLTIVNIVIDVLSCV